MSAEGRPVPSSTPSALDVYELARRIFDRAHLTGRFQLRSGAVSQEYFDKYRMEADPGLLHQVARALVGLLPEGVQVLAGLELGGVPLATVASQICELPTVFVRKQAKSYGTAQLVEGGEVAGRQLAVIEDVVTSGGAVLEACAALREAGAAVVAVLCVIDREAGGVERLAAQGLPLRSVFTMTQLRTSAAAWADGGD